MRSSLVRPPRQPHRGLDLQRYLHDPEVADCGLATVALNLVVPGPGNTFTAVVAPK